MHEYELYFHSTGKFVSHTNLVVVCRWEGKWKNVSLKQIFTKPFFCASTFDRDCLLSPIILLWQYPKDEILIVLKMKVYKKCIFGIYKDSGIWIFISSMFAFFRKTRFFSSWFCWLSKSHKKYIFKKKVKRQKCVRILEVVFFFPNE